MHNSLLGTDSLLSTHFLLVEIQAHAPNNVRVRYDKKAREADLRVGECVMI